MTFSLQTANASDSWSNRTNNTKMNDRNIHSYKTFSYFIIGFLACASNIMLCLVFGRKRSMLQKPYNVIIFTLGIVDLLTGMVLLAVALLTVFLAPAKFPDETNTLMHIVSGNAWFEFTFGKISMLLVMCLALERWFAVARPVLYRNRFTKRRVYIYIILILIAALSFKIHELLPDYDPQKITSRSLVTVEVVVTTFLPLLITWTTYAHLWYNYRFSFNVQRMHLRNLKQKLLRMSLLTATFITICWLPAEIYFLIHFAAAVSENSNNYTVLYLLAMTNSIVNPWVYYLTNDEFKNEFRRLFRNFAARFLCIQKYCNSDITLDIDSAPDNIGNQATVALTTL